MPENGNLEGTSDQNESAESMNEDGPSELRFESAKKALKTVDERLHRSTC